MRKKENGLNLETELRKKGIMPTPETPFSEPENNKVKKRKRRIVTPNRIHNLLDRKWTANHHKPGKTNQTCKIDSGGIDTHLYLMPLADHRPNGGH